MISLHSRIIAMAIGIAIIILIFFFVRKKYMEQLYSLIWILIGCFFITISLFPKIVNLISNLLGIEFSAIGVIVVSIFGLGAILLHLSTIITLHNKKIREFEKKLALMKSDKENKN
tara:strand:- start:1542 stop:1889 length:348 start_codon:yes stop_codon:yes gene_type:complete